MVGNRLACFDELQPSGLPSLLNFTCLVYRTAEELYLVLECDIFPPDVVDQRARAAIEDQIPLTNEMHYLN